MPQVTGPDFLGLQVRDLERAAAFYGRKLGLERMPGARAGVVAFQTSPIPFAVRDVLPGTDLEAGPVGLGVSVSLSELSTLKCSACASNSALRGKAPYEDRQSPSTAG
jgi:catechol 2,3-dioxygenase-like lactoylglutathione lyase family enzyme